MKNSLFILFVVVSFSISAQSVEIKGEIKDKTTNKGISYVSIRLKNVCLGTMANEEGIFIFKLPEKYLQDSFIFSCVGYKKIIIPIEKVVQGKIIQMEQETIELAEVILNASLLNAESILREAFRRIPQNYHNTSAGTYFYRDWRTYNGTLYLFAEAIFDILIDYRNIDGLNTNLKDNNGRKDYCHSLIQKHQLLVYDTSITQYVNFFQDIPFNYSELYVYDKIDNISIEQILKTMKKKGTTYLLSSFYDTEGTLFYTVEQNIKKTISYYYPTIHYTINATDYAITCLKLFYKPSISWAVDTFNVVSQYEKINGKYMLVSTSYFRNLASIDYSTKGKSRQIKINTLYYLTAFKENADIDSFSKEQTIPKTRRFFDIFTENTYNESFWGQYNYIPLEESIKKERKKMQK